MSAASPSRDQNAQRAPGGTRWVEAFRRESLRALLPLFAATLGAVRDAARREAADGERAPLEADIAVVRANLIAYEQRWQDELSAAFRRWPKARQEQQGGLSLISNEELVAKLIGERTIEALEQTFKDPLDHIANRLHSLSAELGEKRRPTNPIAPKQLVEALLRTLPSSECIEPMRLAVLAAFERVCTESLPAFYARINMQLAGSGYVLDMGDSIGMAVAQVSEARDSQPAQHAPRRHGRADAQAGATASARLTALRQWAQRLAGDQAARIQGRVLLDNEFAAVLTLLQADEETGPFPEEGEIAAQLRAHVLRCASSLGIDSASATLSVEQSAAVMLSGSLIEGLLADHAIDGEAAALLARICYPLCRYLITEPTLVDAPAHPVRRLLDEMVWALDANPEAGPEDPALRTAAIQAATDALSDLHEPDRAFDQALKKLAQPLQQCRTRAALAKRRQIQSLEGRQRRDKARIVADRALGGVLGKRALLVPVAEFLGREWHQALMQAWLRSGDESGTVVRLIDTGMQLVELDARAARCERGAVVDGLLSMEEALRSVLLANGIAGGRADEALAVIVRSLADPDQARQAVKVASDAHDSSATTATLECEVEEWFTVDHGAEARRLQLAWLEPGTDRGLLVQRSGKPAAEAGLADLAAMHAAGRLRRHRVRGATEDLLMRWEREAPTA